MASFRTVVSRLYRSLLALYPRDFRDEYGAEMTQLARERSRDEPTLRLIADLVVDTFRTAPREHLTMWSRDIRYAVRTLARNRGFALVAIGSLALGIGANAAIFSLADALLLRPLPITRPSEVVTIRSRTEGSPFGVQPTSVSYRDYLDFRDRAKSFQGMVAYSSFNAGIAASADTATELTLAMLVSGNTFQALGVEPALGRPFHADEDTVRGRDPVAVLSYTTWQRLFNADPGVIGRTMRLNDVVLTIVGVAPERFTGMDQFVRPAVFVPIAMAPQLLGTYGTALLDERDTRTVGVKGRLAAGVSVTGAEAELATIASDLERANPATNNQQRVVVRTELQTRIEASPADAALTAMLMALVSCVLLIACANVANLLLSRSGARSREIAIRLAIGAGRVRVMRQLLIESVVLALVAGALGLAIAYTGVQFFSRLPFPTDLPIAISVQLDSRVLLFTLAASIVSVVIFGLIPAVKSTRTNLVPALKTDTAASFKGRLWGRQILVVAQVALALILLTATAALFRGFDRVLSADGGYRRDHLLLASFSPGILNYPQERTRTFYEDLVDRAASIPGVRSAALTSAVPISTQQQTMSFQPEGFQLPDGQQTLQTFSSIVDHHFFDTLQLPIVRGRAFTDADSATSRRVAIVNEQIAERYWANQDPIGKRLRLGTDGPWIEIVGVARTHKYLWVGEAPLDFLYLPFSQSALPQMTLLLESEGDPALLATALRDVVRRIDASVPMYGVRTMEDLYNQRAVGVSTMLVQTVGALGTLGLSLAVMGLYTLMAFAVSRRTREIGIRMAIGADRGTVLRMVMKQGLVMSGLGVAIGLAGSAVVVRLLSTTISSVSNTDPVVLVALPIALLVVAVAASLVPARRASRLDPVKALRCD